MSDVPSLIASFYTWDRPYVDGILTDYQKTICVESVA